MKTLRQIVFLIALVATAASLLLWQRSQSLSAELAALKAQLAAAKEQAAAEADAKAKLTEAELARLRAEAADVQKLRGEVGQLRAGAKELEKVRTENQQLRTAAQAARASAPMPVAPAPAPVPTDFPKESWSNVGYQTPEATLVTSIWAMAAASPKSYLDSLTPDEQAKVLQRWDGKTEAEIAAKLQGDVARIAGMRVNGKNPISDTELHMSVAIGGAGGGEQNRIARLKLIDGLWKFDGFQ